MNRTGMKFAVIGMAAALLLVAAQRAPASLSSGALLTNFASATFMLPGGTRVDGQEQPGVSPANIPNSASAWVIITDQPTLCLAIRKQAIDTTGNPITGAYPGGAVCFQISFSNCGNFSGFGVTITDVLPANVSKGTNPAVSIWAAGGFTPPAPSLTWATSLLGPWTTGSNFGMVAPLYMRWSIKVGMHKSGFIRYCATIL